MSETLPAADILTRVKGRLIYEGLEVPGRVLSFHSPFLCHPVRILVASSIANLPSNRFLYSMTVNFKAFDENEMALPGRVLSDLEIRKSIQINL